MRIGNWRFGRCDLPQERHQQGSQNEGQHDDAERVRKGQRRSLPVGEVPELLEPRLMGDLGAARVPGPGRA
jgi:hypothetical protein